MFAWEKGLSGRGCKTVGHGVGPAQRERERVHPATDETDENRKFAQQQIVERKGIAEDLSQLTRLVRITGGSSNQKHQVKCICCVIVRVGYDRDDFAAAIAASVRRSA